MTFDDGRAEMLRDGLMAEAYAKDGDALRDAGGNDLRCAPRLLRSAWPRRNHNARREIGERCRSGGPVTAFHDGSAADALQIMDQIKGEAVLVIDDEDRDAVDQLSANQLVG